MVERIDLSELKNAVREAEILRFNGKVQKVVGLVVEARGPHAKMGELCKLVTGPGEPEIMAEVVGFRDNQVLLMPLGEMSGISPGSDVIPTGESLTVKVGGDLMGRVLDGLGNPIDGKGPFLVDTEYPVYASPPSPLERKRIETRLSMGVKAIDALLTCGRGQRIGIFSGSGVGKSTLLGMIARNTEADVNVIGLIGERGREVRDFIEKDLGEEGLSRSVLVVATSDQPALIRLKGAFVATAIAEYFRDQGKDVMLMMDSVTRFATAQREVGLAVGEPPATRGYTPSVFAMLPKLLERSGTAKEGSITALYTVLVEADDMNEPIADTARSILDGHIVLSRRLASQNHYPAIDVLESISRLASDLIDEGHKKAAGSLREVLATYQKSEDLINIGAYVQGSNPQIDYAISKLEQVRGFLKQRVEERMSFEETDEALKAIFEEAADA